jgi:hypothetical protein
MGICCIPLLFYSIVVLEMMQHSFFLLFDQLRKEMVRICSIVQKNCYGDGGDEQIVDTSSFKQMRQQRRADCCTILADRWLTPPLSKSNITPT